MFRHHNNRMIPVFLLMTVLVGCSSENPEAPGVDAVHSQTWIDPNFSDMDKYHAFDVKLQGVESCKTCHGADLNGVDQVPGCNDCHFGPEGSKIPPGSTWTHGRILHSFFSVHQNVCNNCHDIMRQFNFAPAACHDCHGVGLNHPTGQAWLESSPDFHGNSTLNCVNCHDLDSWCFQCHFGATGSKVPPGETWNHGDIPHDTLVSFEGACIKCHTLTRSFRSEPSSCHDCHGSGAHVTGQAWLDKNSADFHGNSALNCASCHDLNTRCSQCHFGESGSKVPAGVTWTHGTTPHNTLAAYIDVCNQCHTLNRSYNNPPAACHDCHLGTTHVTGQPWLDKNSADFHGNSALTCSNCHDLATRCTQCHFDESGSRAPIGSGWVHGANAEHLNHAVDQDVCNQCHSLNRTYGHGPISCHDCHVPWSHPFNWSIPLDNHQSFLGNNGKDATSCVGAICHGDNTLTGAVTFGPTCYQCHDKKWNLPTDVP